MGTRRSPVDRTPLDPAKTVRYLNPRTGRMEAWEAFSKDGKWAYIREEVPGTPWCIAPASTGEPLSGLYGSLLDARKQTARLDATDEAAVGAR